MPETSKTRGKVFWHGAVPKPDRLGSVKRRGTLRHQVVWDGASEAVLEQPEYLMLASTYPDCCSYCKSSVEQGRFPAVAGDPIPSGSSQG